ncbi:hypothetical protein KEM48_013577 [Puccinia striiformis f. sp. tritici PST-130]|uniref:Uncharacterized protein n=1 Tax=Puccinia striiformis f. sp. tritici PST-78 TaxID=1165861 RepID=A0A0L0V0N2_9BASI|nr:hypothetical protein KEM48_013577 [Puccinia striiformis f. sp. tritici PST-130]KNE92838.1 hypothetical protein PSTG_13750 [Puccinia striiformis f. sp. tritici PST-78]
MAESIMVQVKRMTKLHSVARVFEGMYHKYDLPREDNTPCEKNPNLTLDDMGEKAEIWEKLESNLLPSIKEQVTSLLTSLDLHDLQKRPVPDLESTLEILSNLDQTLQSTVSSIVSFGLRSTLPHEKYDHRMKNFKMFRCSLLRHRIKSLIECDIYSLFQYCGELLQSCAMSIPAPGDFATVQQASNSRKQIHFLVIETGSSIDNAIKWYRKSDWAIIQEDWIKEVAGCDRLLEELINMTNPSINPTLDMAALTIDPAEEPNLTVGNAHIRERRDASLKQVLEISRSIIPLVKLKRILVKKLLEMIPRRPIFALDTEINSDEILSLLIAFGTFPNPLSNITYHLRSFHRLHPTIDASDQDTMRTMVQELSGTMESSLSNLSTHFIPLLPGVEHALPESDFDAWSLDLKRSWDKAVGRSLDLISSLDVVIAQ